MELYIGGRSYRVCGGSRATSSAPLSEEPELDLRSEDGPMFLSELPEDDLPSPAATSDQFSEKWPGVLLGVLGLIAPTSQLVCTLDEPSSELAVALLPGDPKLGEPSFSVRKAFAGDPICEEQRTSGNEIEILRPRAGVPSPEDTERSRLRNGTEGVLPAELRSSLTSSSIISSRLSFVGRGLGKRSATSDSTACSLPLRLRKPASRPMSRHKSAEAAAPSTKATSGLVRRAATYSGCARQEPWTACSIVKLLSAGAAGWLPYRIFEITCGKLAADASREY